MKEATFCRYRLDAHALSREGVAQIVDERRWRPGFARLAARVSAPGGPVQAAAAAVLCRSMPGLAAVHRRE
jgi:hypothetical protein